MSTQKPELKIAAADPETGEIFVTTTDDELVFSTVAYRSEDEIRRLVECWNAFISTPSLKRSEAA